MAFTKLYLPFIGKLWGYIYTLHFYSNNFNTSIYLFCSCFMRLWVATVLLVSAQPYTHPSSLSRALACHRIKLKVMNQACVLEAGANCTPQEEEYKILWQEGGESWWRIIQHTTNFLKVSSANDKKRGKPHNANRCTLAKNGTLKSHQSWHSQCGKYYKSLRRKSRVARSFLPFSHLIHYLLFH